MSDNDRTAGSVLLGFIAGAAVGSGLALLFAPKSGRELREQIKDYTDEAMEKIREYTKDAQEKVCSAYEEGKGMIKEKKTIISSAIEAGKEAIEKEREKMGAEKGGQDINV